MEATLSVYGSDFREINVEALHLPVEREAAHSGRSDWGRFRPLGEL